MPTGPSVAFVPSGGLPRAHAFAAFLWCIRWHVLRRIVPGRGPCGLGSGDKRVLCVYRKLAAVTLPVPILGGGYGSPSDGLLDPLHPSGVSTCCSGKLLLRDAPHEGTPVGSLTANDLHPSVQILVAALAPAAAHLLATHHTASIEEAAQNYRRQNGDASEHDALLTVSRNTSVPVPRGGGHDASGCLEAVDGCTATEEVAPPSLESRSSEDSIASSIGSTTSTAEAAPMHASTLDLQHPAFPGDEPLNLSQTSSVISSVASDESITTASGPRKRGRAPRPIRVRKPSYSVVDVASVQIRSARIIADAKDSVLGRKAHTVYDVHVKPVGRSDDWVIHRRYRNFHELAAGLPRGPWTMPELPPKKMVGNLNKRFIEKRRKALERYLQEVCAVPELRLSPRFRDFLGVTLAERAVPTITTSIYTLAARRRGNSSGSNCGNNNAAAANSAANVAIDEGGLVQFPSPFHAGCSREVWRANTTRSESYNRLPTVEGSQDAAAKVSNCTVM